MKILIINYRYFISGGPERYMFDLTTYLEEQGHTVIPFSVKSQQNKPTDYEAYFAEPMGGQDVAYFDQMKTTPKMAIDVLSRLFYSRGVRKALEKLIKDTRPDVAYILNHYNKLSPSIIDACKAYNLPVYMRLSDYFLVCPESHMINGNNELCNACVTDGYLKCVTNKCIKNSYVAGALKATALTLQTRYWKIYDKVEQFICTNEFMKEQLLLKGFSKNKLQVIPTFKQPTTLKPLQDQNNTDLEKKYMLYFGRFSHEKAVDTLVYAYLKSELYKQDIYLYLIGGTVDELQLTLTDAQQSIADTHIKVFGFKEKAALDHYISQSICVVHSSRWYENMPNAILEAFSFNKIVVTANVGSLPYMVNDRVGFLYQYEDVNDLSQKLIQAGDDELRTSLEQNIPAHFKQYAIAQHYERLMRLFSENINH